jgi:hypothetical protein
MKRAALTENSMRAFRPLGTQREEKEERDLRNRVAT